MGFCEHHPDLVRKCNSNKINLRSNRGYGESKVKMDESKMLSAMHPYVA